MFSWAKDKNAFLKISLDGSWNERKFAVHIAK